MFSSTKDGLARAEASWAAHAAHAVGICSDSLHHRICYGFISDNDVDVCWRCGSDHIGDCPELAILQSPPPQVVGAESGREASQTSGAANLLGFQEEIF